MGSTRHDKLVLRYLREADGLSYQNVSSRSGSGAGRNQIQLFAQDRESSTVAEVAFVYTTAQSARPIVSHSSE